MKVEPQLKRCFSLVQNWLNLVNKELIPRVLSINFVNLSSNLRKIRKVHFFFFFFFNSLTVCLYSRSDKAEMVQPFSNDSF